MWGPIKLGFFGVIAFMIAWSHIWSDEIHRKVISHHPITRVDMHFYSSRTFDTTILDTVLLGRIDRALVGGVKLSDPQVRNHSGSLEMRVFQQDTFNIGGAHSNVFGWIYAEGDNWYKSDSLAAIFQGLTAGRGY